MTTVPLVFQSLSADDVSVVPTNCAKKTEQKEVPHIGGSRLVIFIFIQTFILYKLCNASIQRNLLSLKWHWHDWQYDNLTFSVLCWIFQIFILHCRASAMSSLLQTETDLSTRIIIVVVEACWIVYLITRPPLCSLMFGQI